MTQNRSSAVMQQRHEPHDSLDYFPTPPWATRALCERLAQRTPLHLLHVWEPACGEGHMARPLGEYFDKVIATDVHDYSATFPGQGAICDFLIDWDQPQMGDSLDTTDVDWIITNPPFRLAEAFIQMARRRAKSGVAVFLRSAFLEGIERHRSLFAESPPTLVLQFAERVPLVKGRLDKSARSATSYCWLVWLQPELIAQDIKPKTQLDWIAPCRARLESAGDYQSGEVPQTTAPLLQQSGVWSR